MASATLTGFTPTNCASKAGLPVDNTFVRLSLTVEYDGGRYAGSQYQPGMPTIQSEVENAIQKLTGETVRVAMAGRTDAGVHALGQVISFSSGTALCPHDIVCGMNHFLPDDIAVKDARQVGQRFDPRRFAVKREYEYFILNSAVRSPFWHKRAYRVAGDLDVEAMNQACLLLLGEHDFASFTPSMAESERTTIRHMYQCSVRRDGKMVIMRMVASAFLLHQVRNTIGALLRIGQGKMTLAEFQGIINSREFGLAGPTVPGYGLYLNKVYYDNVEEGF
ncbi:MAG: tRNA pseudouridine(38-40) synthase TruA [Dehalococcoidia bacterium]|nr:tRNA pseudouridine(38-40) synthase TruA [Dehalococcoidia bacterium]